MATVSDPPALPRLAVESCDGNRPTQPSTGCLRCEETNPMEPSTTTSPALSVALAVLAVLLALTGFGIYTAFGPPSKKLTDPFDDHED